VINYKLKIINTNIFIVVVKNRYDLGMLFCKVQEFYESPNRKFKNKKFSIWTYFDWYSKKKSGCFSYPKDYCGYNVPLEIARKCYSENEIESPYDNIFNKLLKSIKVKSGYIIGVDNMSSSIFKHELCHALYYTNKDYKNTMDNITKNLSKNILNKFKVNLKKHGYCSAVTFDEIQAYMSTEKDNSISKGISNRKKIYSEYKRKLKDFL
jgi:hypothetical protein